jgi:hypothetical protein
MLLFLTELPFHVITKTPVHPLAAKMPQSSQSSQVFFSNFDYRKQIVGMSHHVDAVLVARDI